MRKESFGGGYSTARVPGIERAPLGSPDHVPSLKDFKGLDGFLSDPYKPMVTNAEKSAALEEDRQNFSRHILLEWVSGEAWENLTAVNRALLMYDQGRGATYDLFRGVAIPERDVRVLFSTIEDAADAQEKINAAKVLIKAVEDWKFEQKAERKQAA